MWKKTSNVLYAFQTMLFLGKRFAMCKTTSQDMHTCSYNGNKYQLRM